MEPSVDSILIVDHQLARREHLRALLAGREQMIIEADNAEEALALAERYTPALIITETELPTRSGHFLLQECKRRWPTSETILVTHNASSFSLLQALRHGAFDFIVRPIDTADILYNVIDRALAQRDLRRQNQRLLGELEAKNQALAQSLAMMKALNVSIERVNRAQDVGELLGNLLDAALDALGAHSGLLALQTGNGRNFGVKFSRGIPTAFCQAHHDHLPEGLLLEIANGATPLLVGDEIPANLARLIDYSEIPLFVEHGGLLTVPLHHQQRTIGMLALFGHPGSAPFSEQHLHFLIQLAHHAALALEKAGIIHQLRRRGKNLAHTPT